jgi:circadian clock protein KaiC
VILLRYAEIESQLRRVLAVVKMRTSDHAKDLRQFQIVPSGFRVEQPLTQYAGVLSGIPTLRTVVGPQPFTSGLGEREEELMHVLLALRDSSVEQLAESMNLTTAGVQQMLDKLVATGYVIQTARAGAPSYRVALVSPVATADRPRNPSKSKG